MSFDYTAPAELFLAKRPKNGRKNYQRFTTAAEALSLSHRRTAGSSCGHSWGALPGTVQPGRCSRKTFLALSGVAPGNHAAYSYLNSLNVIARSVAASCTPRCVSSMTLRATSRVRVAADSFTLGTEHKCGVTDTLDFFGQPTASTAERPRLCGRLFYARLPAPLPTHRGPR
jgi:hypothetical protein